MQVLHPADSADTQQSKQALREYPDWKAILMSEELASKHRKADQGLWVPKHFHSFGALAQDPLPHERSDISCAN